MTRAGPAGRVLRALRIPAGVLLMAALGACGAPGLSPAGSGASGHEPEVRCSAARVAGGGRAEASAIACRRVAP